MYNLVVFLSGNGSTLQSIIDAINNGTLDASIELVVSSNPNAYGLERARIENIDTYVIKSASSEDTDEELLDILDEYDIDLIVLAGYLRKIGSNLLNAYNIINTHPSLLPKFGGKGMYGMKVHTAVVEAKEEFTGPTIHFVNDKYDDGDIIRQTKVQVLPTDTPEDVSRKVQEVEKIQLIDVLNDFVNGNIKY